LIIVVVLIKTGALDLAKKRRKNLMKM